MKKLSKILLLLVIIVLSSSSLGFCSSVQDNTEAKQQKVLFLTLVRNKSALTILDETQPKKHEILVAPIKEKLIKQNFLVIDDPSTFNCMKDAGFTDIQSMEKGDILDLFKNGNFDYIYLLELEPSENRKTSSKIGFQSGAHFKLLKVSESKYLFNGKIYKHTTWGSKFATTRKIAEEISAIVDEKLLGKTPEATPSTNKIITEDLNTKLD